MYFIREHDNHNIMELLRVEYEYRFLKYMKNFNRKW